MKAKDAAQGKWRSVLTQIGIPAAALDGKHHPCPKDGAGEDRFRFADRNGSGNYFCGCSDGKSGGIALVMCCRDLSYVDACKEVERVVGVAKDDHIRPKTDPRVALNRVRRLVRPVGEAVTDYLATRGLIVPPGVRQARLTYWHEGKDIGVFDCMVGLIVSPSGAPQSYHLTYIANGVKADVPTPRKVMTPVDTVTGGAIRLFPPGEHMGIAEGIETAIAAHMLTGLPVWAAANANGVEKFVPPPECKRLTVFGDSDESFTGQAAAFVLAKRAARAGFRCDVSIPPETGDWNDELQRRSAA